jgi:drug/metabolite transporter (DMT)-like permease
MFMRIGAREFGPLPTAGLRVSIAAVFLLPLLLLKGQGKQLIANWKPTFVVGILNSALPFICFSFALLHISTGLTSIMNATVPLFGAAIAWIWLGDKLNFSRTVGLLVGFFGITLLVYKKSSFNSDTGQLATGWAILACLGACLCYGIAASVTRKFMAGMPSLAAATGSQTGAALAMAPFVIGFWPDHPVSVDAWLALAALGVMCSGIAYILFFRLIERIGPTKTLSVTFAIPVFAILYGVLLLGEEVTGWMLGCGLIIVAGTTLSTGLVSFSRSKQ